MRFWGLSLLTLCIIQAQDLTNYTGYSGAPDKLNYIYCIDYGLPVKHLSPKIGASFWHYGASEMLDDHGKRYDMHSDYTEMLTTMFFAFGLANVSELGVAVPIVSREASPDNGNKIVGNGVGDIIVWGKAMVIKESPWFGFRLATKFSNGTSPDSISGIWGLTPGTGQTDIDFSWVSAIEPEKTGFAYQGAVGYRLRLKLSKISFDPGDEGRLQLYIGGMPVNGFGILFGGDGYISFNDKMSSELPGSYRISGTMGLKLFYQSPFGLRFDGGFKFDTSGRHTYAGYGFFIGTSFTLNGERFR